MSKNPRILFLCTGNSARSQMAEGFARYYGGNSVEVDSAGTHPTELNLNAVWSMKEVGIDISQQCSESLSGKNLVGYDCVVTLCGDARDNCPHLPPGVMAEHWPLPDPAQIRGTPGEVITSFRIVRYDIERRVRDLLRSFGRLSEY